MVSLKVAVVRPMPGFNADSMAGLRQVLRLPVVFKVSLKDESRRGPVAETRQDGIRCRLAAGHSAALLILLIWAALGGGRGRFAGV